MVRLDHGPDLIYLEVSDDGCGFDPAHIRQGSLGLVGMRERASLIGAAFDVYTRPGATCVRLDLRLSTDPAAARMATAAEPFKTV